MQKGTQKPNNVAMYSGVMWFILVTFMFPHFLKISQATTEHHYISGKVEAVGGGHIKVSGVTYNLVSNVRVAKVVRYHGSFYEHPAKVSDIMPGRFVSIKVLAGNVYEVIIEEWKK